MAIRNFLVFRHSHRRRLACDLCGESEMTMSVVGKKLREGHFGDAVKGLILSNKSNNYDNFVSFHQILSAHQNH
jgi:hypothetical protein